MSVRILIGDCRERLKELPDASVDSVVCDPPYHLTSIVKRFGSENAAPAQSKQTGVYARASRGFMGQTWDGGDVAFDPDTWAEVLRVLKPGGHMVAFGGTRTFHRLACAIEDAGFEIRDQLAWIYGSGFPKSLDVSKQIDKQRDDRAAVRAVCAWVDARRVGAGRSHAEIDEAVGLNSGGATAMHWTADAKRKIARVATWEQWLRLKAFLGFGDEMDAEVWRLNGRKGQPGEAWNEREVVGKSDNGIAGGTGKHAGMTDAYGFKSDFDITAPATEAARQWQGWGTALKPSWEPICLARKPLVGTVANNVLTHGTGALNIDGCRVEGSEVVTTHSRGKTTAFAKRPGEKLAEDGGRTVAQNRAEFIGNERTGRWPANLCHDGSDEVLAGFPETAESRVSPAKFQSNGVLKHGGGNARPSHGTSTRVTEMEGYSDSGSAARFFYCAKSTTEERNIGLDCCETVSIVGAWEGADLNLKLLVDTAPSPPKVIAVSGTQNSSASEWSTWLFGSASEGRSLTGCRFTTPTAINSTTGLKTWNCLARSITSESTAVAKLETESGGSRAGTAATSTQSATITNAETAYLPGVAPAASGTQLTISVSEGWPGHPTVKPIALMRWLCRLVTPRGGTVLDPFMGSGSTGLACQQEQFDFIGCELSPEYAAIAEKRLRADAGMFAEVRAA